MPLNKISLSLRSLLLPAIALTGLSACGGSDDSNEGYIAFYNASANSPSVYMTLDEDLDDDDGDYFEQTYSSVDYAETTGANTVDTDTYTLELGLQNDDSTARDDLTIIHQEDIRITKDDISFVVLTGDIEEPTILEYSIELLDDDDDDDDDLFNMRFLNLHPTIDSVDVWMSEDDETSAEAIFVGSYTSQELSDNAKFDQDDYKFYFKVTGSDDFVFTSDEISYSFSSQYVMAIRENQGVGSSPFTLDRISTASAIEYASEDDDSLFRVFNAIDPNKTFDAELVNNEDLVDYTGSVDVHIKELGDTAIFTDLAEGELSAALGAENGDYSISLAIPGTTDFIVQNHLLSLEENVESTIFFYLEEDNVDNDSDGDIDENGDGVIDEVDVTVQSLVVETSQSQSVLSADITLINFVDDEDFSAISFFFVRSDEDIQSADNNETVSFGSPETITLLNNTYDIYAVASRDSSAIILLTEDITIDADTVDQFFIIEEDATSASGYKLSRFHQTGNDQ